MMVFHIDMEVEGDEAVQLEGELDLNHMSQYVQNLFKFRNFYNHIDFSTEQCLVITKPIIELTNP